MAGRLRTWASIGGVAGGVLLAVGWLLNLAGEDVQGTQGGNYLVLGGHVLITFLLVGLLGRPEGRRAGLISAGSVLATIGNALILVLLGFSFVYLEGLTQLVELEHASFWTLNTAGPAIFLGGLALIGLAVFMGAGLPKWAGLLVLQGAATALAGGPLDILPLLACGAALAGAGLAWIGFALR